LLLVLLCAVLAASCTPAHIYNIPEQTNDGWQTASLDEVEINEKEIGEAVDATLPGLGAPLQLES
jgi:hypothetical protein